MSPPQAPPSPRLHPAAGPAGSSCAGPGAGNVAYPTRWANPYRPAGRSPEANAVAVEQYRDHLTGRPDLVAAARAELAGKDLACWCDPDLPCHADVLLRVADENRA